MKTSLKNFSRVLLILSMCLLMGMPSLSHAATTAFPDTPPNNIDDLTTEKASDGSGWTCPNANTNISTNWNCTNTSNKDTASCTSVAPTTAPTADSGDEGAVVFDPTLNGGQILCTVTYPDGNQSRLSEVNGQPAVINEACTNGTCTQVGTPAPVTGVTTGVQATTQAASAAATNVIQGCVLSGPVGCLLSAIAYFIFQIGATLLGLAGLLFNWVTTVTVFQFTTYFANSSGFLTAWGILRDVGNIMLLFGFIFMGIATILDIQSFSARKTLPALLIFAVLLNFSLFASEAVVDVANALSSSFYTQAGAANEGSASVGISGQILAASGLATVWNLNSPDSFNAFGGNGALIMFLLGVFCIIVTVVLLAGAIMLFIRAIVLVFLLIASPLGFAAMALPPLKGLANGWWKRLLSEAFFAPVFLLLILVSLKIMFTFENGNGVDTQTFAKAMSAPGSSNVGIFFAFALLCGFMIASLMAAKKLGGAGASFAVNSSTKIVGGATAGTAGFLGRRTIGYSSTRIAQGIRQSKFGGTEMGRFVEGVFNRGSNASFDLRGVKQFGQATKTIGLDFGAPGKTAAKGFHGIEEQAIKQRTDYAKRLKNTDEEVEQLKKLRQELKDAIKEREKARKDGNRVKEKEAKERADELNKKIGGLDAQLRYANNLEKSKFPPFTLTAHANKEAAETLKKKGTKSNLERALATIQEETEKNSEEGEGAGAGDHGTETSSPPPAGGSGPAPAGGNTGGGGDHGGDH